MYVVGAKEELAAGERVYWEKLRDASLTLICKGQVDLLPLQRTSEWVIHAFMLSQKATFSTCLAFKESCDKFKLFEEAIFAIL